MVVSCKLMGGLGNNLFQICCVLSYSLKYGIDYYIPTVIENPHYEGQKVFYSENLKYCDVVMKGVSCFYNEPNFNYNEIPKYNCDRLVLFGYFQSEFYFKEYLHEIRRLLNFDYTVKYKYTCAVHIRRTDYLNLPDIHPAITLDYIREAMNTLYDKFERGINWKFKFYSDDIVWCKSIANELFITGELGCEFSENKSDVEDFQDMLGCSHFIISNSSFSLMASILSESKDKVCIAPKTWFGDGINNNIADLIPDNYIRI